MLIALSALQAVEGVFHGSDEYVMRAVPHGAHMVNDLYYYYYYPDHGIMYRVLLLSTQSPEQMKNCGEFSLYTNSGDMTVALECTFQSPITGTYKTYGIRSGQQIIMYHFNRGFAATPIRFESDVIFESGVDIAERILGHTHDPKVLDFGEMLLRYPVAESMFTMRMKRELPAVTYSDFNYINSLIVRHSSAPNEVNKLVAMFLEEIAALSPDFGMDHDFMCKLNTMGLGPFIHNVGRVRTGPVYRSNDDDELINHLENVSNILDVHLEEEVVYAMFSELCAYDEIMVKFCGVRGDIHVEEFTYTSKLVDSKPNLSACMDCVDILLSRIGSHISSSVTLIKHESAIIEVCSNNAEGEIVEVWSVDPKYPYFTLYDTIVERDSCLWS